jgi:hypothetical protein
MICKSEIITMKSKKIDWIIGIVLFIIVCVFAFYYRDKPVDPVPPAVDAVMTPQERAERACQGDPYYESCVRIVLENMENNG